MLLIFSSSLSAQLRPGIDRAELAELLCISARVGGHEQYYNTDSTYIAPPKFHQFVYRSAEIGLRNLWELWTQDGKSAVIAIRGTTADTESWLENFYAAMVPAQGVLAIKPNDSFHYKLAHDKRAAVHVGWLIGTAFLVREIVPKIDSCYRAGIKSIYITGHSQGGALSYLVSAYLLSAREYGLLPSDIQFKTYSTAAPKPGNLYFAYDYEYRMGEGMAYNLINTKDWVPEVPVSIQTLDDFNEVSPFKNIDAILETQKPANRAAIRYLYKKLDNPTRKAQKRYQKYLGKMLTGQVAKSIDGLTIPEFYNSNHYVRTGTSILLWPADDSYVNRIPKAPAGFQHHMHHAYIYLFEKELLVRP